MSDIGACLCRSQGGSAGVCKQVQHLDRASCAADSGSEPVPVCSLLRKQAGVFKTEGLQIKCEPFVANGPLLRKMEEFPLASALAAAVIVAVHFLPASVVPGGCLLYTSPSPRDA